MPFLTDSFSRELFIYYTGIQLVIRAVSGGGGVANPIGVWACALVSATTKEADRH